MLTIELKRVLKEGVTLFLVLMGLLAAIIVTDKDVYLAPVFEIFLLLYASFTGWSMFDRERSEGAMEYLLSLPVSRLRLLFIKFVPRFLCVLLMLAFYLFVHHRFEFPSYLAPGDFALFYFTFFLVSLSFSLFLRNFISAFLLTSILSGGLAFLNRLLDYVKTDTEIYVQSNLPLLVLPVIFAAAFYFFDIKPSSSFNIRFGVPAGVYVILLTIVIYFFMSGRWCLMLLTNNGGVVRGTHHICQLSEDGKEFVTICKGFNGHQEPLFEQDSSLYLERWVNDKPGFILRLDLETGESETLAQLPESSGVVGSYCNSLLPYRKNFYALLSNRSNHIYQVLEIAPGGNRVIPFSVKVVNISMRRSELLHVSGQGDDMRFFISVDDEVYRVNSMGNSEFLVAGKHLAAWNGRIAVFDESGMILYRLTDSGPLEILFKKVGDLRKMRRRWGSVKQKRVLIRSNRTYFLFDLEEPGFQPVEMPYAPYYYLEKGDRLILVWVRADKISTGELLDGKAVIKHSWESKMQGRKIIFVFTSGILVFNDKEFETFLFDRK